MSRPIFRLCVKKGGGGAKYFMLWFIFAHTHVGKHTMLLTIEIMSAPILAAERA